jgi:hypothetical protein
VDAPDIEMWAVCGPCSRSFFVPADRASQPETVICPVCAEMPARLERRCGDDVIVVTPVAPDVLI